MPFTLIFELLEADLIVLLTRKLQNQVLLVVRKFHALHHDLVNQYGVSVSLMTTDMFCLSLSQYGPFLIHDLSPGL